MKKPHEVTKRSWASLLILLGLMILPPIIYNSFFYDREMNKIRNRLNKLENVEVINMWGHEDVTLEEISARLKIDHKGEIVLCDLSKDVFKYPKKVFISEIGGYSFLRFNCNGGICPRLDIGSDSEIGKRIGIQFNSAVDVIENYDKILNVIDSLKQAPDINHFISADSESYLFVMRKKSKDQDPIFELFGIDQEKEFARTLEWVTDSCYYNK